MGRSSVGDANDDTDDGTRPYDRKGDIVGTALTAALLAPPNATELRDEQSDIVGTAMTAAVPGWIIIDDAFLKLNGGSGLPSPSCRGSGSLRALLFRVRRAE